MGLPIIASAIAFGVVSTIGIAATGSKRLVQIVDGSADIDVGYSLRASLVEPYQE